MQAANKSAPHRLQDRVNLRRQTGVGLIEILIAAAVLSIGFLGIAVLLIKSLSDNNSALIRTQASIAAYSMFDAMRTDRPNALAGNYNTALTTGNCPGATATLADNQLRNWCLGFDPNNPPAGYSVSSPPPGTLLGGLAALGMGTSGVIACTPTGANITASNCSITITFNDSRSTGGKAAQTLVFWTQL